MRTITKKSIYIEICDTLCAYILSVVSIADQMANFSFVIFLSLLRRFRV